MLEMKETQIGEVGYRVRQLTAPVGRKLLVRLFKVFGPPVGAALVGLPEDKGDKFSLGDLQTKSIGDAIMMLSDLITEDELDHIYNVLAEVTQYSREPGKWLPLKADEEFHWAGRFFDMFKWMGFSLEVNYSDFLGGPQSLSALGSAMQRAGASMSQSPKESIGTSTESQPASDTP